MAAGNHDCISICACCTQWFVLSVAATMSMSSQAPHSISQMFMHILTKHGNRPPRPGKHTKRADILLGQGILNGRDEQAGEGGDAGRFDGCAHGIFGLVGAFYLVLVDVRHVWTSQERV